MNQKESELVASASRLLVWQGGTAIFVGERCILFTFASMQCSVFVLLGLHKTGSEVAEKTNGWPRVIGW